MSHDIPPRSAVLQKCRLHKLPGEVSPATPRLALHLELSHHAICAGFGIGKQLEPAPPHRFVFLSFRRCPLWLCHHVNFQELWHRHRLVATKRASFHDWYLFGLRIALQASQVKGVSARDRCPLFLQQHSILADDARGSGQHGC